eukprot:4284197-Amphidinium_carterae.1
MPYRSWCPICVKAKGQSVHHQQGARKEQSLIQLDYSYTRSSIPTARKWMEGTRNPDLCGNNVFAWQFLHRGKDQRDIT